MLSEGGGGGGDAIDDGGGDLDNGEGSKSDFRDEEAANDEVVLGGSGNGTGSFGGTGESSPGGRGLGN